VLRNGKLTVDTALIDCLLSTLDFLNSYIKWLNECLKVNSFVGENGVMYIDCENGQKYEVTLENLKLAHKNYQTKDYEGNSSQNETLGKEIGFEVLESDDFKIELLEGMKEQFLFENFEHIERIENDILIHLNSNSDDREVINEIFRAVHSIKGGTGIYLSVLPPQNPAYLELKKFSEVVHAFESLLSLMRDKGYKFEKNLVDLSLLVMDYFKSFINSVDLENFDNLSGNGIFDKINEQVTHFNSTLVSKGVQNTTAVSSELEKSETTKAKGGLTQSIRVNQEKIDKMMNTISELLIAKNSFMHISSKLNIEYNLPEMSKEVKQIGAYVNRISDELQNAIMSIRMVEIKTVFQKMPRVIRDIAQSTGKLMNLHMEGDSTEIDKTIIEQIGDPLVHLIRNAADHGIETPEERLKKGKSETGRLVLRAYNKNKYVYIEIEDDGKGIDADKMKEKAIEKGFITSFDADRMSNNQLVNLIFLPGFSTAKEITEVSGRGVGMDIVKSNITKINGTVTIESEVDKGTKMIIKLPLTLAVARGLIVEVLGDSYIFPLEYIIETVKIKKGNIHMFNGKCFTCLRGEVIGTEWLCKIFLSIQIDKEVEELSAVIISNGEEKLAIIVDKLKNEQEFVVKTLEGQLASIPGISGSTLLGNGKVVLIVNPLDLLQFAR
jgi:two-component system chemotaxis sensor kinase CheA